MSKEIPKGKTKIQKLKQKIFLVLSYNFEFCVLRFALRRSRAYVTITVLILMMVLSAITYLFADAIYGELAIARNNKGAQAAFSLAEAGVQEAIYQVQHNTTARNYFLAGGPDYSFSHPAPALLTQGSYEVIIDNTAPGVATITSTGKYAMGLRTAQRQIEQIIAQATQHQYTDDDAIYTISAGGESTGDIELKGVNLKIYEGGLASGRSLSITQNSILNIEKSVTYDTSSEAHLTLSDSNVNYDCYIDSDPIPPNPPELNLPDLCSSEYASHIPTQVTAGEMPEISFEAYQDQAISSGQYFDDQAAFDAHFFPSGTTSATATGVVYVEKSFEIADGRTFTMNGILASSGSISIGKPNQIGQLIINNSGGSQPSGVLTLHSFNVNAKGNFSGTGLVYVGEGGQVDFDPSANTIDLTGGILSRRVSITDRAVIIRFNATVIDNTLGNPYDTPVIEINHWEEEY